MEGTRVRENHHSRRGLLAVSALNPRASSPLPAGSMVTFSLLLPRPAEVTAATHSRYSCPQFKVGNPVEELLPDSSHTRWAPAGPGEHILRAKAPGSHLHPSWGPWAQWGRWPGMGGGNRILPELALSNFGATLNSLP